MRGINAKMAGGLTPAILGLQFTAERRLCYFTLKLLAVPVAVMAPVGRTTWTWSGSTVGLVANAGFGTVTVTLVEVMAVGTSPVVPEPKFTVDPVTKPVPVMVSANAAPPCVADVGLRAVTVGAALTVKVLELVETTLPFWTVMVAVVAEASWALVTCAEM
jgi:hypothetical protein